MSDRLSDSELTALVESAASGAVNSQAAHSGGPTWDECGAGNKNIVRESALPFIYHGTKALHDLGYRKPRLIATEEDLNALPIGSVVLSDPYRYMVHGGADCGWSVSFQRWNDGQWHRGGRAGSTHPDNFLPVTVLHEPEPTP